MITALTGAVSSWPASAVTADGTLSIDPATKSVAAGAQFTLDVKQDIPIATTSGTQTDILFDQTRLQLVDIVKNATTFAGSSFFIGVSPQTKAEAISAANTTGRLRNVAAAFNPGAGSVSPGAKIAFTITMSALATANGP